MQNQTRSTYLKFNIRHFIKSFLQVMEHSLRGSRLDANGNVYDLAIFFVALGESWFLFINSSARQQRLIFYTVIDFLVLHIIFKEERVISFLARSTQISSLPPY